MKTLIYNFLSLLFIISSMAICAQAKCYITPASLAFTNQGNEGWRNTDSTIPPQMTDRWTEKYGETAETYRAEFAIVKKGLEEKGYQLVNEIPNVEEKAFTMGFFFKAIHHSSARIDKNGRPEEITNGMPAVGASAVIWVAAKGENRVNLDILDHYANTASVGADATPALQAALAKIPTCALYSQLLNAPEELRKRSQCETNEQRVVFLGGRSQRGTDEGTYGYSPASVTQVVYACMPLIRTKVMLEAMKRDGVDLTTVEHGRDGVEDAEELKQPFQIYNLGYEVSEERVMSWFNGPATSTLLRKQAISAKLQRVSIGEDGILRRELWSIAPGAEKLFEYLAYTTASTNLNPIPAGTHFPFTSFQGKDMVADLDFTRRTFGFAPKEIGPLLRKIVGSAYSPMQLAHNDIFSDEGLPYTYGTWADHETQTTRDGRYFLVKYSSAEDQSGYMRYDWQTKSSRFYSANNKVKVLRGDGSVTDRDE